MSGHSIFARPWWAVCLRTVRGSGRLEPAEKLRTFAAEIAEGIGGGLLRKSGVNRRGVSIASVTESSPDEVLPESGSATLLVQTHSRYFPIGLQDVESGAFPSTGLSEGERDFPRQLLGNGEPIFQYPLLAAFCDSETVGRVFVLSTPYFLLLHDVLKALRPGRPFSTCLGLDVRRTFVKLKSAKVGNGSIKVRSGRMVVVGLPNLRMAEFSGENVIESDLYSELVRRPQVTITAKDCRLGRDYDTPVGGNRRRFVTWFDEHGNFRLTPGMEPSSASFKFLELLEVLAGMQLVRDAENLNPLTRMRWKAETE